MKSGTIIFGGIDLSLYGNPRFTIRKTADPAPPQIATHWRVAITVTVSLSAEMPATVWARARKIADELDKGSEKILKIVDENGTLLSWNARPVDHSSLTEAIKRKQGTAEITFSARQAISQESDKIHATIDLLNGDPELTLDRITSWAESIRPVRPDNRIGHRTEIAQGINFSARASFSDPTHDTATRAAFLISAKQQFDAAIAKEVNLTFAGEARLVQIESLNCTPSEGWEFLQIEGQMRRITLPGESTCEVQFETTETEDPATGETKISISGTVEADEETTAENKIDGLITAYRTLGTRVISIRKSDTYLDGYDNVDNTPTWCGLSFQIEMQRNTSQARYSLQISEKEGADGHRITYSGSATASSLIILLATVETAAGAKHPVEISQDLTISYATDDEGTAQLINATFSREYATPNIKVRGSTEYSVSKSPLGQWITSLSGTISAPDATIARNHARSFIPNGVILRTDDEKESRIAYNHTPATTGNMAAQFSSLQFTYTWGSSHVSITGINYTDSLAPDYTSMTEERTISGQCHAPDKTTAREKVAALLTSLSLSNPTKVSLTDAHERQISGTTTTDRWLSFDFSYSFITGITGTPGHDIISAEWSISRIGQVDHEPMTEVPGEKPVLQSANGYNIGTLTASGTVTARVQATARSWGQDKRESVSSSGAHTGAENPPDERMAAAYIPFQGAQVSTYQFSFTYSFRYRDGLTGLWPSGFAI